METNSRRIVKRLLKEGFELINVTGSHHKFRKGGVTIIVPPPRTDLPLGAARAIARVAGWLEGD